MISCPFVVQTLFVGLCNNSACTCKCHEFGFCFVSWNSCFLFNFFFFLCSSLWCLVFVLFIPLFRLWFLVGRRTEHPETENKSWIERVCEVIHFRLFQFYFSFLNFFLSVAVMAMCPVCSQIDCWKKPKPIERTPLSRFLCLWMLENFLQCWLIRVWMQIWRA